MQGTDRNPEQEAKKAWELLRRNKRFRRFVDYQMRLRSRGTPKALARGKRILTLLDHANPIAAEALVWLVPLPEFHYRVLSFAGLARNLRQKCAQAGDWEALTTKLGFSITTTPPSPKNSDWQWFSSAPDPGDLRNSADAKFSRAGMPLRWGPCIETVTTREQALIHLASDGIGEWREYFSKQTFDLGTSWQHSPQEFQRRFTSRWATMTRYPLAAQEVSHIAPVLLNLITRLERRLDSADQYAESLETELELVSSGQHIPDRKSVKRFTATRSREETEALLELLQVSKQRLFIMPQLRSKGEATYVLNELAAELGRELPKARELLGTREVWNAYEGVEQISQQRGLPLFEAITPYIRNTMGVPAVTRTLKPADRKLALRYLKNGFLVKRPEHRRNRDEWGRFKLLASDVLREVDRRYRTDCKTRVVFISQLIAAVFPRPDCAVLFQRSPSNHSKH